MILLSTAIPAIERTIDAGAEVVNLSIGLKPSMPPYVDNNACATEEQVAQVERAITSWGDEMGSSFRWIAEGPGIDVVFTVAAGNACASAVLSPFRAAADLENVITVSSVNSDGNLTSNSNLGTEVAAGGGVFVRPDDEMGSTEVHGVWSTLPGGEWGQMYGTSMAAPLVAGIAALIRDTDANLTAAQVGACITETAGTGKGSADTRSRYPLWFNKDKGIRWEPRIQFTDSIPIVDAQAALVCTNPDRFEARLTDRAEAGAWRDARPQIEYELSLPDLVGVSAGLSEQWKALVDRVVREEREAIGPWAASNGCAVEPKAGYCTGVSSMRTTWEGSVVGGRVASAMLAAHAFADGTNSESSVPHGLNADTSTSEILELQDFVVGGASTLAPIVQSACGNDEAGTCQPSANPVSSEMVNGAWTVTHTGLRFWFAKGRMGANAAGITWVHLPWTAVAGSLTELGREVSGISEDSVEAARDWHTGTGLVDFVSPTGNIGCVVADDVVRCDIAERNYADPQGGASCERDYGSSLVLDEGSARLGCVGDTILYVGHQHPTLEYGQSVNRGPHTCSMSRAGVRCEHIQGHGFTLAREAYTAW